MTIIEICDLLRAELMHNGYQYGFVVEGQIYKPNMSEGFDAAFYHLANTLAKGNTVILAIHALEGAARKKHRSRAIFSRNTRLLPHM